MKYFREMDQQRSDNLAEVFLKIMFALGVLAFFFILVQQLPRKQDDPDDIKAKIKQKTAEMNAAKASLKVSDEIEEIYRHELRDRLTP